MTRLTVKLFTEVIKNTTVSCVCSNALSSALVLYKLHGIRQKHHGVVYFYLFIGHCVYFIDLLVPMFFLHVSSLSRVHRTVI